MKNKFFIIFLLIIIVGISPAVAQKKQLTLSDISNPRSEVINKPIPRVSMWIDDEHYRETNSNLSGSSIIDVKNGVKVEPESETAMPVTVRAINGKLIYSNGKDRKVILQDSVQRNNVTLSPDNKWIAFTSGNNLYAVEVATSKLVQYTFDGSDVILNGEFSWVYYEEIMDHSKAAFWWSPDSKYLGFYRTDESKVPVFPIFDTQGQHGSLTMTRYPKAGDPNPEVKVGIVGVEGGATVWADFDDKADQYFGKPYWSLDSRSFWVQWMPREQNQIKMYAIDVTSGKKTEVYNEEQSTWVEWKDDLYFLKKQGAYIVKNDTDGWDQLYLYNNNGRLKNKITNGKCWNTKVLYVDEAKQTVYFTSARETSVQTDFYSVKFDGSALKRLTFGNYDHRILLSPGAKYFITYYSNVSTPIHGALVDASTGKIIRQIADSRSADFDNLELAKPEIVWYTTPDGFRIPAVVTLPLNMDKTKKYPVIINTYGGPNRGNVVDRWWGGGNWRSYEGIISVTLDHRGSGHCGRKGLNCMHRNLGKYEIEDYITFVQQCLYTKPFVDRSKIAIEGHSYGGYLTALALTKGADYFKYGIANAGVMDWMLYDTHYTERFMDTPQSNPEGYKAGSVLNYVDNYNKTDSMMLYIRHGLADDNVHSQNSIQLIDKLELLSRPFEMMFYPGCGHSFLGAKFSTTQNDYYRFYYRYLLNREVPEELLSKNSSPKPKVVSR